MRLEFYSKVAILLSLFAAIVFSQYGYDATKAIFSESLPDSLSVGMIHATDMGFDSTVASFLWAGTMPEILDIFNGKTEYLTDRVFVSAVDPKLGYPYAYSVLTLPVITHFPAAVSDAMAIGQEGILHADPDWRIPYYMGMNYYVELNDPTEALWYFDLAARTPGVPAFARLFALNFGTNSDQRTKTMDLWVTIRDSTNDPFEKERAQAYIDRLQILDYLESAAKVYKQKYGSYPTSTIELVSKGIIPQMPQDPFGYQFIIKPDGTAGVAQ